MEITKTVVQQALDEEDVEGLLQLGAPKDEYSYEAETISSRLREADANEDVAMEIIRAVWMKAFDLAAEDNEKRSEAYRRVAKRILGLVE